MFTDISVAPYSDPQVAAGEAPRPAAHVDRQRTSAPGDPFGGTKLTLLCCLLALPPAAPAQTVELPNDPDFSLQWSLHNTGQVIEAVAGTPGADMDLLSAWVIHPGGSNVTVALVGTGVNPHGEFADRLLEGYVSAGAGGDPFSTLDTGPRGTREAGIIAAAANNLSGIAGVNPRARILPVRVMNSTLTTPQAVADGIVRAVDGGAEVVAIPLRIFDPNDALRDAVGYAAANDVLCVAPMGNTGDDTLVYPAVYDACIAVAATTNTDQHSSFSNFGEHTELAAPGVGIYSTTAAGGFDFESVLGGQSATALVAGLASLIRSYAPQLQVAEVRQILLDSADDLGDPGWDPRFGAGRVNARRALEMTPPPALRLAWENGPPSTILPNRTTIATVTIGDEAEALAPDSAELIFGVPPETTETSVPLAPLGGDRYAVSFPALSCGTLIEYSLRATGDGGATVVDPPRAPTRVHRAAAITTETLLYDDFETDAGWQSQLLGTSATGEWDRVDPVGTFIGNPPLAVQPEYDASADEGTLCYVTGQHNGGSVSQNDVDGGPVALQSPVVILPTADARVSYWRWVYSQSGEIDSLLVEVSRDGGTSWHLVEAVTSAGGWERHSFRLSDVPAATGDALLVRFVIGDVDDSSLTEAAVDEVHVEAIYCNATPGDVNDDGTIDLADHGLLAGCLTGPAEAALNIPCVFLDLTGDGAVELRDVGIFQNRFSP